VVTVLTDSGERATVTFEVERSNEFIPYVIGGVILFVLLVVTLLSGWYIMSVFLDTAANQPVGVDDRPLRGPATDALVPG
jgi:hypothetical protein